MTCVVRVFTEGQLYTAEQAEAILATVVEMPGEAFAKFVGVGHLELEAAGKFRFFSGFPAPHPAPNQPGQPDANKS